MMQSKLLLHYTSSIKKNNMTTTIAAGISKQLFILPKRMHCRRQILTSFPTTYSTFSSSFRSLTSLQDFHHEQSSWPSSSPSSSSSYQKYNGQEEQFQRIETRTRRVINNSLSSSSSSCHSWSRLSSTSWQQIRKFSGKKKKNNATNTNNSSSKQAMKRQQVKGDHTNDKDVGESSKTKTQPKQEERVHAVTGTSLPSNDDTSNGTVLSSSFGDNNSQKNQSMNLNSNNIIQLDLNTNSLEWQTDKDTSLSSLASSLPTPSSSSSSGTTGRLIQYQQQEQEHFLRQLSLEREAMFDPNIHLPYAPQDWTGYQSSTPLSDFIMQRIGVSGRPITIAEYMRHALTHPLYGYYTNPPKSRMEKSLLPSTDDNEDGATATVSTTIDDRDWDDDSLFDDDGEKESNSSTLFGRGGDFVTAPELSNIFGHCICIWLVTQWQTSLGGGNSSSGGGGTSSSSSSDIQLVEFGPGRGTLMVDILQLATTSKLSNFGQSIHSVHLIEASKELRNQQQESLQKSLGHIIDFDFGGSKTTTTAGTNNNDNNDNSDEDNTKESAEKNQKKFQIRVEWHDDFASFQYKRNTDMPVMMILQEFLDALPVHVFQKTEEGWRERMIDVASVMEEEDDEYKLVDSTTSSSSSSSSSPTSSDKKEKTPRLRQVLAPDMTPAAELLVAANENYNSVPVGTVVEVCPEALMLIQDMAKVIEESDGFGIIVDYGEDGTSDTLRAFSNHRQVPLTSYPGQVDVTADVDFFALRNSLPLQKNNEVIVDADGADTTTSKDIMKTKRTTDVHAFGPVPQGEFLMRMGVADMVIQSIEKDETTEEQAQNLSDALKYLILPDHMGTKFKVLTIGKKRDGIFAPAGMEA